MGEGAAVRGPSALHDLPVRRGEGDAVVGDEGWVQLIRAIWTQPPLRIQPRVGGGMRARKITRIQKTLVSTTGWSTSDLPPRHKPINARTQPMRAGWEWQSAKVQSGDENYLLVAECNASKGNWKALLLLDTPAGHSVIARFEDHASHPGTHVHAHCERCGVEVGSSGMSGLERSPKTGSRHRRTQAWTKQSFWAASLAFFRISEPAGTLI